ncbi:MAG: hypothetical protein H3Z52_14510, partial [archaeon]|nr:hypothetical protein [archaeon]
MSLIGVAYSKSGKRIRLTSERWGHVIESHNYMAGQHHLVLETVSDPEYIVSGGEDEFLAIKFFKDMNLGTKYIVVVYKEVNREGFIITAFMTSTIEKILRRGVTWQKQ